MPPKKKKTKKEEEAPVVEDEVLLSATDLEPEPEEVQFTDTSYTSASFESLPPVIVEEVKPTKKKKKKQVVEEEVTKKTSSEMFNWSEESMAVIEEQKPVEEEEPPPKKKDKKGKKGKKEVETIPEFDKPVVHRQAILAGAKEKRAALARERNELLARDIAEQEVRRDILQKTCDLFQMYEGQKITYMNRKQMLAEWQQYLRCDGLPDPRVVTQMNTYLHVWRETGKCDDNELEKRCREVLPMLDMLEEFVSNSRQYTPRQAQNYNEVRLALRAQIEEAIELASYTLLRDLEKYLKFESIKLAIYQKEFNGLRLNLWVAVKMPTRKPKPVESERTRSRMLAMSRSKLNMQRSATMLLERLPVELSFPALKVDVKLPSIIDGTCVCVRASRSMIDLLSEKSKSFPLMGEVPNRYEDLFTFNVKEHIDMIKFKTEFDAIRAKFYKDLNAKIRELEAFLKANMYTPNEKEKEELDNLNMSEPPPLPDPRAHIADLNEKTYKKFLKKCNVRTRTGEVNLRKYRICGGVLNLDLLVTPPQPKRMRHEVTVTSLQLPKALQPLKYQVQYRAPSPPAAGVTRTPEEIEAEMKKVEAEYEKLALVSIELPQEVIWSEPPIVCQWQDPRKLWTSNYVNDYKYNEDKLTVQFRTGVLWPIGIATLRYSNMPYQGWDIKPDPKGKGVNVTVTGVSVTVTFNCISNYVKLKFIANANTPALKEHFNKKYNVKKLIQLMKDAACDFFPDFDGYNHVEGSCQKEWVSERHLYHAMAFLSRAYNFQWSRWNAAAGTRNIIIQMREAVDKKRESKLQLLHVTPQRATLLKQNEMTQDFNLEPMEGFPFFPDLYTLNMRYGSVDARRTTFDIKYRVVETVFDLLQELKLCSYS